MVKSASNAGPTNTAVTMNTDPAERKYPTCTHGGGGKAVADGGKARIAAEPLADCRVSD